MTTALNTARNAKPQLGGWGFFFGGRAIRLAVAKLATDPARRQFETFLVVVSRPPVNALNERERWNCVLAEETIFEFIDRRRRELGNRRSALVSEVEQIDVELAKINASATAIGAPPPDDGLSLGHLSMGGIDHVLRKKGGADQLPEAMQGIAAVRLAQMEDMSIRNLVKEAFRASRTFKLYGATNAELREFIRDAFKKDIERSSLSPALSRMRDDGLIVSGNDQKWRLPKSE